MKKYAVPALAVVCGLTLPQSAQAQWGAEMRGQMSLGGDEIASVEYSDGSDSSLKMGTYFSVTAGPSFQFWSSGQSMAEVQAMVGWAGWSTGPENTDDRLSLHRFPAELLVFYGYRLPDRDVSLRFGGGVAYHVVGGLSGSGSLEGFEMGVDNSVGPVAEASAIFGILSGGLRYTYMNNSVEGFADPLSGSSISLFLGITNPRK